MDRVFAPVPAAHGKIPQSVSEHIKFWGNEQWLACPSCSITKEQFLCSSPPPIFLHVSYSSCVTLTRKKPPCFQLSGVWLLHGPAGGEPGAGSEGGCTGDGAGRPALPKGSADLGSYLALFPPSPVFVAAQL